MNTTETIDRQFGYAMKGVAIIVLMLHNFLHKCGFSLENEWKYLPERTDTFLNVLTESNLFQALAELLSFSGWTAICAFAFLSGYGLEKKYSSNSLKTGAFIWNNWLKLLLLMLPGTLFFALAHWQNGSIKYLFSLTMLANLFDSDFLPIGVYWYFGFTFELYLFWLIIRKLNVRYLLVLLPCFMLLQSFFIFSSHMEYLKMNLFGWGQVFVFGIVIARKYELRPFHFTIAIASTLLLIFSCLNRWTWLIFTPFLAVLAVWSISALLLKCQFVGKAFVWVGSISAFLFAIHPIMRAVTLKLITIYSLDLWLVILIYLISSFSLSLLCRMVIEKKSLSLKVNK